MTGLKQIENQRAFEQKQLEAKEEPAYQLLQDIYTALSQNPPILTVQQMERVRVYLTTGILLQN